MPKPVVTPKIVGYTRVSTDGQADSGLGLTAQGDAIRAAAAQRGWSGVEIVVEVASGGRADRPILGDVIASMRPGDTLIVSRMDRLSRSTAHGARIIEQAMAGRWNLVVLDLGVDLSTPAGEMVANVVLAAATFERRLISVRTKEALAVRKAQGVRLGRPSGLVAHVRERIAVERAGGATLASIAEGLNADGVLTSRGGHTWRPSQVRAVLVAAGVR